MNSLDKEVIAWFLENKRDLPWRKSDPWGVMVSEFMLQQTPMSRVLPKWSEWMERWPTPAALATAATAEWAVSRTLDSSPHQSWPQSKRGSNWHH